MACRRIVACDALWLHGSIGIGHLDEVGFAHWVHLADGVGKPALRNPAPRQQMGHVGGISGRDEDGVIESSI